ncbi:MAG: glycoside hydrolase [Paludibacter sp.]|nr:glycoside hydrolase [Paludibacter sp.]
MKNLIFTITGLLFYCNLFATQTAVFKTDTVISTSTISVSINPFDKHQSIDGWGGSLCWWANIMGGYSDEKITQICNWITSPVSGLNMNIFRFNIGGGDALDHKHMRTDGGNMPGYKDSLTAPYNWKSDANQRKILQRLIAARIANVGINDVTVIGFSNSPPWWMTVSGCASGSVDGLTTNLKADMFDNFADYLTDVTRHYHDSLGITFNNLEPFNEPFSNWWKANGGQEGCRFTQDDQHKMIRVLYAKMQQKNMLSYCRISAMDANSIDEEYDGLIGYQKAGDILSKISRIDVHSYAGTKRAEIAKLAATNNLPVWQSESGPLSIGGSPRFQMLTVCDRIITDFKELNCKAWIDWQLAADDSPQWGLLVGKYKEASNPVEPGIDFYLRAQFSRFLKIGYRIIPNNAPNVLTAISPDEKELVIIASNSHKENKTFNFNLSSFDGIGIITKVLTCAQSSLNMLNQSSTFTISEKSFSYEAMPESVCTFTVPVHKLVRTK